MIPNNGTIEIKQSSTAGGFDDEGNPIAVVDGWSVPIDCRIVTNNRNVEGKYQVGKTYDFEKQRADYLIELGFVELVKEKTK